MKGGDMAGIFTKAEKNRLLNGSLTLGVIKAITRRVTHEVLTQG